MDLRFVLVLEEILTSNSSGTRSVVAAILSYASAALRFLFASHGYSWAFSRRHNAWGLADVLGHRAALP